MRTFPCRNRLHCCCSFQWTDRCGGFRVYTLQCDDYPVSCVTFHTLPIDRATGRLGRISRGSRESPPCLYLSRQVARNRTVLKRSEFDLSGAVAMCPMRTRKSYWRSHGTPHRVLHWIIGFLWDVPQTSMYMTPTITSLPILVKASSTKPDRI